MNFKSWLDVDLPGNIRRPDHILIATVFLLTGWGLVTLYSSSYAQALRFFNDGNHFISRQTFLAAAGILLFLFFSRLNLVLFRKLIPVMLLGTFILCCLTFVPGIGIEKNGATRWIGFGTNPKNPLDKFITLQPSEFIKICLPFYLANTLTKKGDQMNSFIKGILTPTVVIGLFFFIVYKQNNFSTAVFIVINCLVIFFLAGVQYRWFAGALALFIPLAAFMILTETHRLIRVLSFLNPSQADPRGAGYQIHSSLRAIGSGGFWGKGLGQGTWKVAGIPEVHSDFIFAAFAEEVGLLGVILFLGLFTVFAVRGYLGALRNDDGFSRLLGLGLVTMIVSQVLLNLAVVAGLVPTTGLPLPFFSAGGTYITIILIMAGFIVNITRSSGAFAGGINGRE